MKKHLDFIIIGAQKAGTTSLFRYLGEHPKIYMPPEKEIPFFAKDSRYLKGWDWFLEQYYQGIPEDSKWGKASPQYLADYRVPERIHQIMPNVKLIALLRNPIDRALSHYKMMIRRRQEPRNVEDALGELMQTPALEESRRVQFSPSTETMGYLVWGEYGRLLEKFLTFFPREQIKILFFEDLAVYPQQVVDETLEFIGLEPGFVPPNLGIRYYRGGTRFKVPFLSSRSVKRLLFAIPGRWGRRTHFWLDLWNVVPEGNEVLGVNSAFRETLRDFFREDVRKLEILLGRPVPWREFTAMMARK